MKSAARSFSAAMLVAWTSACADAQQASEQPSETNVPEILLESWETYVERFIDDDGRVIDPRGGDISTSEGQVYAMLRAVWVGDRGTFDRTFAWALDNLNEGVRDDHLWAWKWGETADGRWEVLDPAFASDADQDAAVALILAWLTWEDEAYLEHAREILADLWELGTLEAGGHRYLLAGDTLCDDGDPVICRINPSYYAPYMYRVFARYDPSRDWSRLVDASYHVVERSSRLTGTGLPPDWVDLDTETGALRPTADSLSAYSYDAFRTHWRIAFDAELFGESRADPYLSESLHWILAEWEEDGFISARISPSGESLAEWEAPEMLSGLLPAVHRLDPEAAATMFERIRSGYSGGIWFESESYYIQNWAWFGTAFYHGYLGPWEHVRDSGG